MIWPQYGYPGQMPKPAWGLGPPDSSSSLIRTRFWSSWIRLGSSWKELRPSWNKLGSSWNEFIDASFDGALNQLAAVPDRVDSTKALES